MSDDTPYDGLRNGDEDAVRVLWERFFDRMVSLARSRLASGRRRVSDEEDVALSAFASFCRGAREGRFPELADRDGLWRLLLRITERKCIDLHRRETRAKRGGGRVQGESAFGRPDDGPGIDGVVGREPDPRTEAICAEELQQRLESLKPELREIALARLAGLSIDEIAAERGTAKRTVERRLTLIRRLWSAGAED